LTGNSAPVDATARDNATVRRPKPNRVACSSRAHDASNESATPRRGGSIVRTISY
jgi:hypothetical protein